MTMELRLDDLRAYARCPLEWFWEQRAGVPRPLTPSSLVPLALRAALAFYYQGYADTLARAVGLVWQDWCRGWGEPGLIEPLLRYSQGRARILKSLAAGNHRGRRAPAQDQLLRSGRYRQQMRTRGLAGLARGLDDAARAHDLVLEAEGSRGGSEFGDAFSDCLAGAERMGPSLPAQDSVLGWQTPYVAEVGSGVKLLGTADLVTGAPPQAGEGAVILEVHDHEPEDWVGASAASRDLRVIAAWLARPAEGSGGRLDWERVDQVVYRHWPSGKAYPLRVGNTGHLAGVLSAAVRGMTGQALIPRALTGGEYCRACAYREHCLGEGRWETLPLVDPGTRGCAEALREVTRRVREAVAGDEAAAQRARKALDVIEAAVRTVPDPEGARAVLEEGQRAIGDVADGQERETPAGSIHGG